MKRFLFVILFLLILTGQNALVAKDDKKQISDQKKRT